MLSSSSCRRPASLDSSVLTSTPSKLHQIPREKGVAAARSWRHRCKGIGGDNHDADDRAGDSVSVVGVCRRAEVTPSISRLALSGPAGRFQMRRVLMGPAMGAQVSAASFLRRAPPLHVWANTYSSGLIWSSNKIRGTINLFALPRPTELAGLKGSRHSQDSYFYYCHVRRRLVTYHPEILHGTSFP
ncbi:uncharacterized protein [Triticum aestivum]|uniref:uncharacterized protein isoform X2 n=1 Tax=Triticum aestivum TaxID=4565 RepID=UPI001D02CDA8|nr:uncharacterized protein LOC123138988 isoform X2 [Triticum aestivum]